jgi:imidazolonepropionase-like amidohydrolase
MPTMQYRQLCRVATATLCLASGGVTHSGPTLRAVGLPSLAIVHVTVIPMDRERTLRDQTVLVEGGEIVAMGPADRTTIPAGAQRVDGRGRYLIPGLVDMHTHFIDDTTHPSDLGAKLNRSMAALYVAGGVTSAMSLCGIESQLALRDSIRGGQIVGPRLVVSGPCIDDSTMTVASGDSLVRHDHAAGYDFLKVYSFLSVDGFRGVTAAGRRLGMPVVGHIPLRVGLFGMLAGGAVDIAHIEEFLYNPPFRMDYTDTSAGAVSLDTMAIPRVVDTVRHAGAYVTTTLIAYRSILDGATDLDELLSRPCSKQVAPALQQFFNWDREHNDRARRFGTPVALSRLRLGWAFYQQMARALAHDSVPLLAGTDGTAVAGVGPGCGLRRELELLVAAGLTPYQSLRAATATPGEFFSRELHWPVSGTVMPGARADLVLLGANPLADIGATAVIIGVVANGHWLSAEQLQARVRSATDAVTSASATPG